MRPGTTHRLIAVYHKETGAIRQMVECNVRDAGRQHEAFDGHASLDVTDYPDLGLRQPPQNRCHPKRHAIHPQTLAVIPKVTSLEDAQVAVARAWRQHCEVVIKMAYTRPGDFNAARTSAFDRLAEIEKQIAAAPDIATLRGISW